MKHFDITHHDPNEPKRWPLFAGLCFLVIILINLAIPASAQVIQHHNYKIYFNPKLKCPDSVSWNLTPAMVLCKPPKRIDKFAQDKSIPNSPTPADFTNSHYDKGHLFSFDDAACDDIDRVECFYMTNMLAQTLS